MSQEIQTLIPKDASVTTIVGNMDKLMAFGQAMINTRFVPDHIKKPEHAVAIILTGNELGIPPMQSMRQINVIQGKPTISTELMLNLAYSRVDGFVCDVIESTEERCIIELKRAGSKAFRHEFTIEDARSMGLINKDNWKKQPKVMLRWRCIASGLRVIAPDALNGVLLKDEIEDVREEERVGIRRPETKKVEEVYEGEVVPPPSSSSEEDKFISDDERRVLFELCKKHDLNQADFQNYLINHFGIDSSKKIRFKNFEEVKTFIMSHEKEPEGQKG